MSAAIYKSAESKIDYHENPYGFSRNDEKYCHLKQSGVSQVKLNRDISVSTKPQYDKSNGQQYDNIVSIVGGNSTYSPS